MRKVEGLLSWFLFELGITGNTNGPDIPIIAQGSTIHVSYTHVHLHIHAQTRQAWRAESAEGAPRPFSPSTTDEDFMQVS